MKHVLVIYNLLGESTIIYKVEADEDLFSKLTKVNGCYGNVHGNTAEQDDILNELSGLTTTWKPLLNDNNIQPGEALPIITWKDMCPVEAVVITGFMP